MQRQTPAAGGPKTGAALRTFAIAASIVLAGCMSDEPQPKTYPALRGTSNSTPPPMRSSSVTEHYPDVALRGDVEPLGAGTLTIASVEPYMDGQEKDLRAKLRGNGILVSRRGDAIVIGFASDALFAEHSLALTANASEWLGAIARVVRRYDSTNISVNAYTDTTGTAAHNLDISQKRANAIAAALSNDGVERVRLHASGFGQSDLKIPTGLDIAEPRNRRIEIEIVPRVKG